MKSILNSLSVMSILLLCSSCEKAFNTVINIDIPHTPIIALDCINIFDSTYASISSTVSVTGTVTPASINNANVKLYENNILVDSFSFDINGGYRCPFINYKPGSKYKITASAPSFASVETEDECPGNMDIVKSEFTKNAKTILVPDYGNVAQLYDEFKITFKNSIDKKDYYKIEVSTNNNQWWTYILTNDIDIDKGENQDILSSGITVLYGAFTMTDINFNGKEKTLTFYAPSSATNQIDSLWNISISHLSENFYKFEKTRQLYNQNEGNPFAEPVQVFSNVKNGVGIFALKKDTVLVY